METSEMKGRIQQLMADQNDPDILQRVYELLEKAKRERALREVMIERALRAEEDIKAGRVLTPEEFRSQITDYIKKGR